MAQIRLKHHEHQSFSDIRYRCPNSPNYMQITTANSARNSNCLPAPPFALQSRRMSRLVQLRVTLTDFRVFCSSCRFRCFTKNWSRIHFWWSGSTSDTQTADLLFGSARGSGYTCLRAHTQTNPSMHTRLPT